MPVKTRIAVVSPFLDRRHGTERCVVEQVERFAREPGWEIHLYSQRVEDMIVVRYSPSAPPAPPGSLIWHKVPSIAGPLLFQFLWWFLANHFQRWFDARFRSLHFDLVYSPGINCLDADAIAVHIVFRELVCAAQQNLDLWNSPLSQWARLIHRRAYYRLIVFLEKRIYPAQRVRLAAVSQRAASELARHFGCTDVAVIPNAVEGAVFHPAARGQRREDARQRWAFAPEDFVLLLIGNDWKMKGLPQLLEAMARCRDVPFRLLAVGRDDPSPYAPLLERLSLRDHVRFAAPSPDVLQFYAAADAYATASVEDAFGLPVLEAMACGLPAIASAQSGVSELITDGMEGFVLSEPRDAAALARLIRLLWEQSGLRQRMGENAARTAQQYTWDRNAADTMRFLKAALAGKRGSSSREEPS